MTSVAPQLLQEEGAAMLCADTLAQIFEHLSAFALVRMGAVCKAWRTVSLDDGLWGRAAQTRWQLPSKSGRYKFGERSWREVYRVFHRRNRIPTCPGIGEREVIYAAGRRDGVAAWLLINHQPACRLSQQLLPGAEGAVRHVLRCRVAVQNLREGPIDIDVASCLSITMRDSAVTRPLDARGYAFYARLDGKVDEDSGGADGGGGAVDGGADGSRDRTTLAPPARAPPVRLMPLELALLSDVCFPAHASMLFEPDFLEAAHCLRVRASAVGCCAVFEVPCAFASEEVIWRHYELITRDFYVHVDREE